MVAREVRTPVKPPLSIGQILDWARAHFQRTGKWPSCGSGPVIDAPAENWSAIDLALARGVRGLPGGMTLSRLLCQRLGKENHALRRKLTIQQVLAWADAHWSRTGRWPKHGSGPIVDAPGEKWSAIDAALKNGVRGLPRGGSLARLLEKHRRVRNIHGLAPLTEKRFWPGPMFIFARQANGQLRILEKLSHPAEEGINGTALIMHFITAVGDSQVALHWRACWSNIAASEIAVHSLP